MEENSHHLPCFVAPAITGINWAQIRSKHEATQLYHFHECRSLMQKPSHISMEWATLGGSEQNNKWHEYQVSSVPLGCPGQLQAANTPCTPNRRKRGPSSPIDRLTIGDNEQHWIKFQQYHPHRKTWDRDGTHLCVALIRQQFEWASQVSHCGWKSWISFPCIVKDWQRVVRLCSSNSIANSAEMQNLLPWRSQSKIWSSQRDWASGSQIQSNRPFGDSENFLVSVIG